MLSRLSLYFTLYLRVKFATDFFFFFLGGEEGGAVSRLEGKMPTNQAC